MGGRRERCLPIRDAANGARTPPLTRPEERAVASARRPPPPRRPRWRCRLPRRAGRTRLSQAPRGRSGASRGSPKGQGQRPGSRRSPRLLHLHTQGQARQELPRHPECKPRGKSRTSSTPCSAQVSTSATCSEAASDDAETTPGATSRWKACASAPGRVTIKPDSISARAPPPPSAAERKGPMRCATSPSASLAALTGSALWLRVPRLALRVTRV